MFALYVHVVLFVSCIFSGQQVGKIAGELDRCQTRLQEFKNERDRLTNERKWGFVTLFAE